MRNNVEQIYRVVSEDFSEYDTYRFKYIDNEVGESISMIMTSDDGNRNFIDLSDTDYGSIRDNAMKIIDQTTFDDLQSDSLSRQTTIDFSDDDYELFSYYYGDFSVIFDSQTVVDRFTNCFLNSNEDKLLSFSIIDDFYYAVVGTKNPESYISDIDTSSAYEDKYNKTSNKEGYYSIIVDGDKRKNPNVKNKYVELLQELKLEIENDILTSFNKKYNLDDENVGINQAEVRRSNFDIKSDSFTHSIEFVVQH